MREDNKSTDNSKMSQRKDSLGKKISVIFKALLPYINRTTVFTVILGLIYFLALMDQTFALTAQEIAEFQSNEMVSGMCYIYDIMTSNVTRAIAAAFVIGTGWLFFFGEIKDWKPVLTFSIAITLIFGGFEIANIISRNDYSCTKPKQEVKKDETIDSEEVEPDVCRIRDIDEYSPQQKWKVCTRGSDGKIYTECSEIYDDFEISYKESERDIILVECQNGYLKVAKDDESNKNNNTNDVEYNKYYKYGNNTNLKYKCTRVNSKTSKFVLINNNDEAEKTRCQRACAMSKLDNLSAVNMIKKDEQPKIQAGSGRQEGDYFVVGTRITLECEDGFTKYEENKGEGIVAICKTNGEFEIKGGCNGKCKITNLSDDYKNSVKTWQKYNNEENKWEDVRNIETETIYSDGKIRAKECNEEDGYSFGLSILSSGQNVAINDDDKVVFTCSKPDTSGVSNWSKEEGKKECSKFCELYNFVYYNENAWKRCENNTEIKKGEHLFEIGSCLIVNGCANQDDYSLLNTPTKLKLTCESNKDWKMENENNRCYKKCDPKDIGSYENASKWEINSPEETATRSINASDFKRLTKVANGTTLKQTECKDGYDFNGGKTPSTFECKDGKLERQDGLYDEKCMPKCFLHLLGTYDEKSLTWTEIYEDGRNLTPENKINPANVSEKEMSSSNHYFKLDECIKGYKRFKFVNNQITEERATDNENFIYYCDNSTSWVEFSKKAMCAIVKCRFDLETVKADIGATNYDKLGIAYSNQWINLTDNNKSIPIMKNNGVKYLYATKVKLSSCIQQTGTYLLGNKDTVLMCNEEGQWQLFNSDTNQLVNNIPSNNTKRCMTGMCKDNPLTTVLNAKNSGSTLLPNNREGTYYNSIANTLYTITDSTTDMYATDKSIIDAGCSGTGIYEVGFGGTCNNCGSKSTTAQPHYYYCDNGTWKSFGSCFKGCNSKPSLITNSKFASANKTIYNSGGSSISASDISNQSGTLYYTNGVIIQGDCDSGYTEMTSSSAVNGSAITYTCNNGSWTNSGGKCLKLCHGGPSNASANNIVFNSSNFSVSGTVYSTAGITTANVNNMNNVYYGNNSTITGGCKSGYSEVDSNGNPNNNAIVYTCNNGSWNKGSGRCEKMCIGRPTLDAGSNYCGYEGTFYDANMNVTKAANSSSYAKHGAIFDVNCSGGYQEIYLIASAYNSSNGNKPNWGHYYYCNNGNWVSVGRCLAKGNKTFSYTGGSQPFTPPINSNEQITLTLEVYGAQGGGSGGKGGYTKGSYTTKEKITLNIVVGGQGGKPNGGYNGGGNGAIEENMEGYGGGGATHISTTIGMLNSTNVWNNIMIVAGGGGGSGTKSDGGYGGGANLDGGNGKINTSCNPGAGGGGTLSSGGQPSNEMGREGSAGKGGIALGKGNGGGGGGYYGGAGGGCYSGGGGGSGYCGINDCDGENGANGSDTEIDGVKTNGDGYAKISW